MSTGSILSNAQKRQPSPTHSDEDTENDEDNSQNTEREKGKDGNTGGEKTEELLVKKKARHSRPFTEDILTLPDGLPRIYEEFPRSCVFRGRGSEARDIKKLMAMYREWAFQLHPGLAFADVTAKCESLGQKPKTKACLQALRDRERDRYIIEVLGVDMSPRDTITPTNAGRDYSDGRNNANTERSREGNSNNSEYTAMTQHGSSHMSGVVEESLTSPEAL